MRLLAEALQLGEAERTALFLAQPERLPPQHELPRYGDVLIERAAEIAEVVDLMSSGQVRLVTLTGPGGVGKTRVAVAAANAAAAQFEAGVRWVHVMSSDDEEQLIAAVAAALGLDCGDSVDDVAGALPDRELLLVIDGAEPFLETVASVCDALTRRRTGLRVLVTSRERLHLAGERPLIIAPLACADPGDDEAPGVGSPSAASRLFLTRAPFTRQPRTPAGEPRGLSAGEAAAVARICRRVDGIPLAIELAADRTALLTVGELATALDKSLRYLYSPHADDEVALRDVMVADSYHRLSRAEQEMLARLSVFSTSFTSSSVAAVCDGGASEPTAVDVLSLLVSKSLVLRGADVGGTATFRLLRVVREFADDQLSVQPGAEDVRRRHAHYYRDLAVRAADHLVGADKRRWSLVLDAESDNLRQALEWCLRHDNDSALTMVGALWRWWHLRGHYREGRSAATTALRAAGRAEDQLRATACTAAGLLALLECDYEAAQTCVQQGLDLYSGRHDQAGVRWSLALLGSVALQRGEYTVASQLHEQALVLATRDSHPHSMAAQHNALAQVSWLRGNVRQAEDHAHRALEIMSRLSDQQGIGWALLNLGATARYGGDLNAAEVFLTHSLRRSSRIDYREGEAWALNQLGVVSRLQGSFDTARSQQQRSLELHRRLGNRWRAASVLDELAAVALATDLPEQATAQLGAADQLRREIGAMLPAAEKAARDHTLAGARSRLGTTFPALTLAGLAQHQP